MYNYQTQKPNLFTDDGQRMFLQIRDRAQQLLRLSGAVRMEKLIADTSGDVWDMMACVDRLVELGELQEIPQKDVAGQHRIFVSNKY